MTNNQVKKNEIQKNPTRFLQPGLKMQALQSGIVLLIRQLISGQDIQLLIDLPFSQT
jgi:hypothetical protein